MIQRPLDPLLESYPLWYNPNTHFPFHEGEGFFALKPSIQELISSKIMTFREVGPNVKNNHLPALGVVNAIEEVSNGCMIEDIKTSLLVFYA